MKLILNKSSLVVYIIAIGILVVLLFLFYRNTIKVKLSSDRVEHTQIILNKSNDVLLDILNLETGIRGYLVTKNKIFLEPYYQSEKTINQNIKSLKALTINNAQQQIQIDSIQLFANRKHKNIQLEIELFNQNKLSDYQKITYLTEGKKLTDKIRASVAVIHNIEINQLVIRKKANDRNVNIFNILFLLIFTTILILLFIVFIIFRNQKIKNDYAKELEAQVADRTKELAIQNIEKEKRANELTIANRELNFQNAEKENRANELIIANKELNFQNTEKGNRADELMIANIELQFQNTEKEKRAEELVIADKELAFQNAEKEKRAAELIVANYARSLIEASRDPLITISTAGKIMDVNIAMQIVTEKDRSMLIDSSFENYFTDADKAKVVYQQVFEKGFVEDFPLTLKDGKLVDVLFNGSVYKDNSGNVLGAVIVARDVTEQNRISAELTEAKVFAELAAGIAEVAQAKAEDAVKSKQQFLSNMSHEIRTPMNAIIGFTKVILKTDLTAHQREYLSAIKLSGDALIVLINDILDLAKVDAGKMAFEKTPFKLALSINAMVHLFEPKIEEKNIQLIKIYDENIPDVIEGDPVRLHQIIINLLSNAVKFTKKGSISVSVKMIAQTAENVTIEFSVSDSGLGISANKLDKIFDNFQQASSSTSRIFGGTGLGLAIVKQLVEGQKGKIAVQSELGVGSTFTATITYAKTNAKPLEEDLILELDDSYKNIRVLVVEDILLNQLLMKTLLDDFGFASEIVSNGKLAVEILQHKQFDVVLMDLQMPEMNGYEATDYIRNTLHSSIPIIALTADVTTVDVDKCKKAGMNDYISKPVDERILYSKIIGNASRPVQAVAQSLEPNLRDIKLKCIDLSYLMVRTKSNTKLITEIINAFLEQTPVLISAMKESIKEKNWKMLHHSVHKIIPSFAIMGMDSDLSEIALKIQNYAILQLDSEGIAEVIATLEKYCTQACEELQHELIKINNQ